MTSSNRVGVVRRVRMPRSLSLALALALAMPAAADDAAAALPPVAATADAAELLRAEVQATVARLIESGAFGATAPEAISMSLAMPAERVVNVGLLVDSRSDAARGLPVLGTLPGGDAQAIGVRAGDVLTAVNGRQLTSLGRGADGQARAVAVLKREIDALSDGGELALDVLRGDETLKLARAVEADYIPAMRLELGEGALVASTAGAALPARVAAATAARVEGECGRITIFHVAPRSQKLYRAKVLLIDGEIPGPSDQETFRVSPGRHVLEVSEQIDTEDLPTVRSRMRRNQEKVLEIDVAPNTTYLIASRLNNPNTPDFGKGAYWDPVVWKSIPESCR